MITALISFLFLAVGLIGGWLGAERYIAYLQSEEHEFEELFERSPHPELFDEDGNLFRGEYISLNFPPDYDPSEDMWFSEDVDDEM